MKRWKSVAAAALLWAGAAAAESGINGPVSGFVLDARSRSLRPVNGMPGAALLGAPLAIPFQVRLAAVAARRDFALVAGIEDDSPAMLVRGLAQAAPEISGIEGAISGASRMALSGGGAAAVLYSAGRGQMQALTGLPDGPRAGDLVDVSGLGEITALAVDDSGARIFAGTADGVYLVAADGEARRLAGGAGVAAIATANNGRDLVFASQTSNEIVQVRDVDAAAEVRMVGAASDGVDAPVGLAVGGNELWVANRGTPRALVFDLANPGPPQSIDLPGTPTLCDRLNGGSLLVFNEVGAGPLLVLDAAAERTVFFIPVD